MVWTRRTTNDERRKLFLYIYNLTFITKDYNSSDYELEVL